jgi:hypothetical protein
VMAGAVYLNYARYGGTKETRELLQEILEL